MSRDSGDSGPGYGRLEGRSVLATVEVLQDRIGARLPGRGLNTVCAELVTLVGAVEDAAPDTWRRLRTARRVSRVLIVVVVVAAVLAVALATRSALGDRGVQRGVEWLPLVESGINDVVFAAIAVYFLHTLPERLLRGRLLALLHRLRSLAHIIDMHQLTKDPERLRADFRPSGLVKPLDLDRDQLERYLDYCSEMLSLVAKTAALCAEESRDAVVLETVGTIETLTSSMSQKIWQKISLLSRA